MNTTNGSDGPEFDTDDAVRIKAGAWAGDTGIVIGYDEGNELYLIRLESGEDVPATYSMLELIDVYIEIGDLDDGDRVVVVSGPLTGEAGVVLDLNTEATAATGVPVYDIELDDGTEVTLDEASLELSPFQDDPRTTYTRGELSDVSLDPTDPFERVLIEIVETNRRKRQDYALDGNPFSNFDDTSRNLGIEGFTAVDSALFNILQKVARLRSLRANGRLGDPANESVADTLLDLAVYGVIALAISRYPDGKVA